MNNKQINRELPHVCFVAPALYPLMCGGGQIQEVGGAEVQQYHIIRFLLQKGYRVSVVSLDYGQPEGYDSHGAIFYKSYKRYDGIPVLRFFHPRMTSTWQALKRAGADIYYQRNAGVSTGLTAAFCRRYGKKFIYAGAHDTDFMPGKQLIQFWRDRKIYEYGLKNADAVVVQNEAQQTLCKRNYGMDSLLIPSIYRPLSIGQTEKDIDVLWVATVKEWKRPQLFLDLARILPNRRFVMVGGPPVPTANSAQYFDGIRHSASLLPNVVFLGFLPFVKTETYFDRAKLFMNTSEKEGMPNTFLQSWARKIPTLSYFVPQISGTESNPIIAINSVAEAGAEVENLLGNEELRIERGNICHDYYQRHHSGKETIMAYEELFANLTTAL